MNCDRARPLLPLFVYGDLSADESAAVAEHAASCAECRGSVEALGSTRAAFDSLPMPEAVVNPADIVRSIGVADARSARRWRRVAIGATALAAGVSFLLLVRPTIRIGDGAFVVRWSEPPARVEPSPSRVDDALVERVELLGQLVRALADESEGRDRDRKSEIALLKARLELLNVQIDARYQETRRDVGVLYRAQFDKKELNP